mmetsp:Transcript_14307/g.20353  ORF Transcript_14307/g.20353 Transcript_14307/m.20353 type:complete len:93 (-) Transcript_14307:167-445(-)
MSHRMPTLLHHAVVARKRQRGFCAWIATARQRQPGGRLQLAIISAGNIDMDPPQPERKSTSGSAAGSRGPSTAPSSKVILRIARPTRRTTSA